jgi:hypothetical protein
MDDPIFGNFLGESRLGGMRDLQVLMLEGPLVVI